MGLRSGLLTLGTVRRPEAITSGLVIGFAAAFGFWFITEHESGGRVGGEPVHVGMRLSPPAGYLWRSWPHTLVLGLRVGCPFCEKSAAFYENLAHVAEAGSAKAHLLAVFPDSAEQIRSFMAGLPGIETLPRTDLGALNVSGTPTVILVDGTGTVERVWIGLLTSEQQGEVMRQIGVGQ